MRSEARKVHDLFFDILKIAFPDTDFREARSALTFTSSVAASASASGSSPRVTPVPSLGQPKRQKQVLEVDPPPRSSHPRGSGPTSQRETRFGSNNAREPTDPQDDPHPGELVICKKKRKDREKSAVKPGTSVGREIKSPGQTRLSQSQQGWSNNNNNNSNQSPQQGSGSGSGGGMGWAKPVKKMRTDSGKRRPSHM